MLGHPKVQILLAVTVTGMYLIESRELGRNDHYGDFSLDFENAHANTSINDGRSRSRRRLESQDWLLPLATEGKRLFDLDCVYLSTLDFGVWHVMATHASLHR